MELWKIQNTKGIDKIKLLHFLVEKDSAVRLWQDQHFKENKSLYIYLYDI